jgi:hypothetical protein
VGRPVYERSNDRLQEQKIAELAASKWGVSLIRLAELAGADYMMVKHGELKAIVEIKNRSNPIALYPTYMISAAKISALNAVAAVIKAKPLLIVQWTDCAGWLDTTTATGDQGTGGRADRSDPMDVEECIYIPVNQFRRLR